MKKITVRTKKEFDATIREHRANGFMIVTYTKRFVEMERGTEFIVIER